MNSSHDQERSDVVPRYSRRQTVLAFILFGIVVLIFGFGLSYSWLDTLRQDWFRCEVVDAEPQRGSNLSPVAVFVSIETTDCGSVAFQQGTTEENVEEIASSFEPGEYEFKFGMMSQFELWAVDKWYGRAPNAKDFRPVE